MKEENATNENKPQAEQIDTTIGFNISGHILIRDKESGEEIVNKRNAIHYGNLGYLIANSIGKGTGGAAETNDYIHFMAFGNGASSVDSTGRVLYKSTNTSETRETDATLYRKTYAKVVSDTDANPDAEKPNNKIEVIEGAGFTDLKVTCTLGLGEPAGQDNFDTSANNEGDFIFDELGLMTYSEGDSATTASSSSELLTHVVFHPVQKSANRIIEVVYTLRIQMT